MSDEIDRVDGWEIRSRPDGFFGVYDAHGMVEGPFETREDAMAVALALPRERRAQAGLASGPSTLVNVQKSDARSGSPR